jgi:hypothetical protein
MRHVTQKAREELWIIGRQEPGHPSRRYPCLYVPTPPFGDIIQRLISLSVIGSSVKKPAIVSVDIPSGWHVEEGDADGGGIKPDMLVSILLRSFMD